MTKEEIKAILDTCEPSLAKQVGTMTINSIDDAPSFTVLAEFNWFKELSKKDISDKKWHKMEARSNNWITCACGNQCAIIPRERDSFGKTSAPIDPVLKDLGYLFNTAVKFRDTPNAINILFKIEERSAELIKEIKSKQDEKR